LDRGEEVVVAFVVSGCNRSVVLDPVEETLDPVASFVAVCVMRDRAAIADWPRHADAAGVPSRRAKQIADYFVT